jgi:hypothetical protein
LMLIREDDRPFSDDIEALRIHGFCQRFRAEVLFRARTGFKD